MKRETVKSQIPNITDEQLDWLMGENGKDITAEKSKATELQTKLDTAAAQLKTAQDGLKAFDGVDVAQLQSKITQLQNDMAAQADGFSFDTLLDGAIRDAKGKSVKAVRGMLDVDALKASKDRTADIKAALEALTQENAWAFEQQADPAQTPPTTPVSTGNPLDGGTAGGIDYAHMTDDAIYAQLHEAK